MWERDEIERLLLWHGAGLSQGEIARRLGKSKHAVSSKCHQLKLARETRPPPPLRGPRRPPEMQRAGRTTLPPLASLRDER